MIVIIGAAVARTRWNTHFTHGKALAIHFQAFCFFAGASNLLLFYQRS
jgi:hypothetical protein